jgi:hypothetical protein
MIVALAAGVGARLWWRWAQRPSEVMGGEPSPVPDAAPADVAHPGIGPPVPWRGWVPPVDGEVPDGYPIKAKETSMIYHVPGSQFYARTKADRWYADTADAEADGFRAARGAASRRGANGR